MEDVCKLLDNGWDVLLFRDSLGQYSALAVRVGRSVDGALKAWVDYHPPTKDIDEIRASVFSGPNRLVGVGPTVADALRAVTEKVLFGRLPAKDGDPEAV